MSCWGNNQYGQLGVDPGWLPVDVIGFGSEAGFAISGRVRDGGGSGLSGITVTANRTGEPMAQRLSAGRPAVAPGASYSAVTDGNGDYLLAGLPEGLYRIAAAASGYAFTPISRTVTLPPSAAGQDFTGTAAGRACRPR